MANFINISTGISIAGSADADSIVNNGNNVTIYAGEGNDTVVNKPSDAAGVGASISGANVIIYGGDGADFITNTGANVTINPGAGDDTIVGSEHGEVYLVGANTGNNLITNLGVNDTLQLVNGTISAIDTVDDNLVITIESANHSGTVTLGGAGQYNMARDGAYIVIRNYDEYSNTLDNVSIATSDRADSIVNSGSNVTIRSAGADDTVENSGANVIIETGADDDVIVNGGVGVTIRAGLGDDSIVNSSLGSNAVLDGGAGIDTIINAGAGVSLTTGDGNDYVNNTADNVTIDAGLGSDRITNSGAGVLIGAGEGTLGYVENTGSNVTIRGGAGADYASNEAANVYFNGGAGDDTFYNAGSSVTINGGAGADSLINDGASVTIDGGAGADRISNSGSLVAIYGGEDNDSIYNGASSVTINGGDGDDYISNSGASVAIDAGAGNDTIENTGSNVTIQGGAGNDTLNRADVYQYSSGNDVLTDYAEGDTIHLMNGVVDSASIEGTDVILHVGDGTVRLIDKKTTRITVLDGEGNLTTGYYGVVYINNTVDNTLITAELNDYLIDNSGSSVTIDAGTGNDTINNAGADAVIGTGDGINRVENEGDGSTVNGGSGSDTVSNSGANVVVDGGSGADYVYNYGSNVTLTSGNGNDSISNGGSYALIRAGAGADSVYNYGANVTINGGAGNDTVISGGSYASIVGGDGADYISVSGSDVSVDAGAGNDSIISGYYATIAGGAGNDTINRAERYRYSSGDDVITSYAVGDTIELLDQTLNSASIDGENIVFNVDGGSITVLDGRLKQITLLDGDGSLTFQYFGALNVANTADNTLINVVSAGNNVVENAGNNVTIESGGGDDYVVNSGANAMISGGAGADIIDNSGANATINLGAGDDSIANSSLASYAVIDGGAGNDIVNNHGAYSTIGGGAGDDSVRNEGASAVINGGDGQDTIENYGAGSSLNGGAGNDYVVNSGASVDVDMGEGDNIIRNGSAADENVGAYSTLRSSSGSDNIENYSRYTTIDAGAGNDIVINYGSQTTVDGGAGDDTIENHASDAVIDGGADNDLINNYGASSTVKGGDGNDYIYNTGASVNVDGGAGDDSIFNDADGATIDGGAGDDVISLGAGVEANVIIYSGGNDTLYGFYDDVDELQIASALTSVNYVRSGYDMLIDAGANGTLTVVNALTSVQAVNASLSLDTVTSTGLVVVNGHYVDNAADIYSASFKTVAGWQDVVIGSITADHVYEAADDASLQVISVADNWTVRGTIADDSINASGSLTAIDAGDGNDRINNSGDYASLNAGEGDNFINNYGTGSLAGGSGDGVTITSGAGNDTVRNRYIVASGSSLGYAGGDSVMIEAGDGDNHVENSGNDVTINAGSGADTIDNNGDNIIINAGAGADSIVSGCENVTINGAEGDDTIENTGSLTAIYAGAGNDLITNDEINVTLNGGDGDDSIVLRENSAGVVIEYADGDGNDSIVGYDSDTTTLEIANGLSTTSVRSGDNIIISAVGSNVGSITLIDAAGDIESLNANVNLADAGGSTGYFVVDKSSVTDFDSAYNASFVSSTIDGEFVVGTVDGAYGYIASNDTRQNITVPSGWKVLGTDDEDTLVLTGSGATVDGGAGSDVISISGGAAVIEYGDGGGDDTICGYSSGTTALEIASGLSTTSIRSGDDIIINAVGSSVGSITLIDAGTIESLNVNVDLTGAGGSTGYFIVDVSTLGDLSATYDASLASSTVVGDFVAGSVDAVYSYVAASNTTQNITVDSNWNAIASDNADAILLNGSSATVEGGGGADRISLASGSSGAIINYALGDGNDSVYGYAADDATLRFDITNPILTSVASGSNLLIYVNGTSGRITLVDFSGAVNAVDAYGNALNIVAPSIDSTPSYVDPNAIVNLADVADSVGYFVVSAPTDSDTFYAASFASVPSSSDVVVGNVSGGSIYAATSNALRQNITVTDNWNVTATQYDDSIAVEGNNATITSGDGNDSIFVGASVAAITFGDFSTVDAISFADAVSVNSLFTLEAGGNSTLYSDQIALSFIDRSVADFLNTPFGDLIYSAPSTVNAAVELSSVSGAGSYVVNGREAVDSDTFYDAAFVETVGGYDVAIGDVAIDHVYSARSLGQQRIIVGDDNWSITTGDGADSITVGAGVSSITFTVLDDADTVSFERPLEENSLLSTVNAAGGTVLYSDQINLTFADQSLDDLLNGAFAEYIYAAPSTVNANIILSDESTVGSYVVNGREAIAGDTFYDASFVETVGGYDVAVGSVDNHKYVAGNLGHQSITVGADNWSITTGEGEDSINVGASVAAIAFNVLDADDVITFERPIEENSLFVDTVEGGTVLYSDQISLTFADQSLDDLLNSSFADLIYSAPSTVNANIILSDISTVGSYVVNGREAIAGDTFYDATFVETVGGYDVAVGDVLSDHVYSARSLGHQSINVTADNWSITTTDGTDSINVGASVAAIAFNVPDADDVITFERPIDENSLLNRTIEGGIVLYSDQISITFADQSLNDLMSSAFADYIYAAPSIVNANIELNDAAIDGSYVINGRLVDDPAAFYDATLTADNITLYDVSVGSVNNHNYVASDLGRQSINVTADNWSITTAEGADSINVGAGVSSIAFNNLDTADVITFERPIDENSLLNRSIDGGTVLYSDQISITFADQSLNDLMSSSFADYIYAAPSIVNANIELNDTSIDGSYVINGRLVDDSATFYDATLTADNITLYDVSVGSVNNRNYVAGDLGRQSINVTADNWSITTAEGADSINVGASVAAIAFTVLDSDDVITFEQPIKENSLLNRTVDGGTVLYSDQISLSFADQSLDDLRNSAFADYIYDAPSTVNANIILSDVSTVGSYVVNGQSVDAGDTFYDAAFVETVGGYDVAVGDVLSDHVYSARSLGQQRITVGADNWSITTGDGADSITVGAGVSALAFNVPDAADVITFEQPIKENSLLNRTIEGGTVLYSDQISLTFADQSLDELRNSAFADLIYDAPSTVNANVILSDVSTVGSYVVNGQSVDAGDTFYDASFVETVGGYDVAVGDVSSDHVYSARSLGLQRITVGADNWSINTGEGADSITVGADVSALAFNVLDADDSITFERPIDDNSLLNRSIDGGTVLYSDQISLTFADQSLDDLRNSTFADYIYDAPSTVNSNIILSDVSIAGSYVVNGQSVDAGDTFYDAAFVETVGGYDVAVGSVDNHKYVAGNLGLQRITVGADNWSITTGEGADSITVGVDVSAIAFNVLDGDDAITFEQPIKENSLLNRTIDGGTVLYSDQISLTFADQSLDDLRNSFFADLIYDAPSTVNSNIILSDVSIAGSYVVNGQSVDAGDTFYDAAFVETVGGYDVAVGSVDNHKYVAGNLGRQSIIVTDDNWSITTGDDADSITVGADVSAIAFNNLDDDDVLSFDQTLDANSLLSTVNADGGTVLYSNRISLAFADKSVEELRSINVVNGGTVTAINELLYDAPSSVNANVELTSSASNGSFVVDGHLAVNANAFYNATLTAAGITLYDVAVGSVDNHNYVAGNLGRQRITVSDNNWSIKTAAGADSIIVGSGVSSITFSDLDTADAISLNNVSSNSLFTLESDGNSTLYSDQISIAVTDRSVAEIMNSALADYIYDAPSIVNANIELTSSAINGNFVVDGHLAVNSADFYNATLTADNVTAYDIAVGSVDNHNYVAGNLGRQSITVTDDNWSITSGNGADSIIVGADVSSLTFNTLDANDEIIFRRAIESNSLLSRTSVGGTVLYSDQISITFADQSLNDLRNSIFADYIYDAPSIVNANIELTSSAINGNFVVDGHRAVDSSAFYNATLTAAGITAYDIAVGSVNNHNYVAGNLGRQSIIVTADNWSITSGNGADSIIVGAAVGEIAFNNLENNDVISFSQSIELYSLTETVDAAGNTVLYSDQITLAFNQSIDDLLDVTVDNAGTSNSIAELIAIEDTVPNALVDLSQTDGNGVYVLNDSAINDTLYNTDFIPFNQSSGASDIVVGTVEGDTYTARSNFNRQAIAVNAAWNVNAAELDDFLYVTGSGATITSGEGSDTIVVDADVSTIVLTDLSSADLLAFTQRIDEHSLSTLESDGNTVLYSDRISLTFKAALDDIINYTVNNGDTLNTIADLIVRDIVPAAAVDLTSSGTDGFYVIDGQNVGDDDAIYAAHFTAEPAASDIIVGTVEGGSSYVARENAKRQEITAAGNWLVKATAQNDLLKVIGNGATVNSGEGNDTVAVDAAVSTIAFIDHSSTDVLSFVQYITPGSLSTLESDGGSTLFSDQITITFDKPLDEILSCAVDNAGTSNIVADLIVRDIVPAASVDLSTSGSNGFYVVDGQNVGDDDAIYAAHFTAEPAANEIIVGTVEGGSSYIARDEAKRQEITVNDNWLVKATAHDDSLNVIGNGSTIAGGAGNDTVALADNVVNVVFADHDSADLIALNRSIAEHSLISVNGGDGATLSSDSEQLTLVFDGRNVDELVNYSVDNGGDPLTLEDLIYSPIEAPKAIIDLTATDADGVYVVDGRIVSDIDAYYAATFTHSTLETDYIVGALDGAHQYSARSNANAQQITAHDYWRVTATKYDDLIKVEGGDVTINTGKGNDTIVIGDGATTITFGDLDAAHDALSFYNAVEEKSMSRIEEDGNLILTSEALTLAFEDKTWAEMRRYVVDNGGVDTALEDLIKVSTHHMDLATWDYDYEAASTWNAALGNGTATLGSSDR